MKKRLIFTATLLCGIIALTGCSKAPETPKQPTVSESSDTVKETKLSEMDENTCRQYLEDMGVRIPDGVDSQFIKGFLKTLEKDPTYDIPDYVNWTVPDELNSQLRVVVNMYYHRPELPENTVLSQMDENECKQFLTDAGVRMFDNYNMTAVQNLLAEIEKNPDMKAPSQDESLTLPDFLYDQLRVVVNMYYK